MKITAIRRNDDNTVDIDFTIGDVKHTTRCHDEADSFGIDFTTSPGVGSDLYDEVFDVLWDTYAAFDAAYDARENSTNAVRAAAIYVATVRDDRDPEWIAMQIANHPDERADVALLESSLTA